MNNFTIVTAVTPEYRDLLYWGMSSWVFKPQLRDRPLIVFYNGMKIKDLGFVLKLYPNARLIEWNMNGIESKSELMFSSFVFGAAQYVETEFYMKMDADAYCTSADDIWIDSDFSFDIIGHKWHYTKPGWFIDALENYYSGSNIVLNKEKKIRKHARFESYCCLHRTSWVKTVVQKLNGRLPVPSHDTTLWFYANKDGKWGRKNIKSCGVTTASRWKSIREEICKGDIAFNPSLNDELMAHVQLEITSRCNIGCNQCDRNCGAVDAGPDMDVSQVWDFIDQSISIGKKWKRIDIIGGEPTFHKNLSVIFDMVKIYKDQNPRCKVRFSTNGCGDQVNKVIESIPSWVEVRNSSKVSKEQPHDAYRVAPVDAGETTITACSVPWRCGIGLTRHGYFPCGAGASLSRVFGFDIGIKQLKDVTPQAIKKQMLTLCKYCGHSNCASRNANCGNNEMSASWEKAIDNYDSNKMSVI